MPWEKRLGDRLTERQKQQEAATHAAMKLLKEHGYECEVRDYVVFSVKDDPCALYVKPIR